MRTNLLTTAAIALLASGAGAQSVYTYTQSSNTGNNLAIGIPPPVPVASLTPVAGFRDYASLFARHQDLMLLHDEVTGQQVGTTTAGRAIWAYVLTGTNTLPGGAPKPAVMMVSGWKVSTSLCGISEPVTTTRSISVAT